MRRCTIIVGPYRSGTSVTAGVLHHLGVDMGLSLPPGNSWNVNGSFCDSVLHYHLLELYHQAPGAIDRVKCELDRRGQAPFWGIKDHKLFETFPLVMPLVNCDFQIILCQRPRADSLASFQARRGDGREGPGGAGRLFAELEGQIGLFLRTYRVPCLDVHFAELAQPPAFVKRLADFVGRPITQASIDIVDPMAMRFAGELPR